MAFATLEQLKAQTNTTFNDDDDVLQHYLDSAEEYVRGFLDVDPEAQDPPLPVPDTVNQAVLLIAAGWYETRENAVPDTLREIPFGARELLNQVRGWTFG
ncbi:MAG: Uncharacterized phage protein [Nitrobacter sp.]|uniref:head-tail connector protein n=1 Tax=Nitrobacter sp. TaxID=29420 RepID=UPI00387DE4E0